MRQTNKLFLLLALLLTAATGAWAQDYYAPSTDEVIILNDVYEYTYNGRSSHSAIAWGGAATPSDKKAGDPNNEGQQTSSTVSCYSVKGTGQGKDITLSITGVSKVIVYHERNSSRYIELRDGSKTGNIIGSGEKNTYYTEVELTATNKYSIFLHGTSTGSNDQDFYVYAIKLIAAPAAPADPAGYTVSMKDDVKDADKWTITPNEGLKEGDPVTLTYTGRLKVKGVKATSEAAPAAASLIVNPVVGQIIGSDGKNYDANATLPDGVTKVAMIAYVSGSNGLAIQLNASPVQKNWSEAKTYVEGLTAVPGGTWRLPSKADWQNMFVGCAKSGDAGVSDNMDPIAGFKEKIDATGITWQSANYWSSTDSGSDAWGLDVRLNAIGAKAVFDEYPTLTFYANYVLGCLAFTVEQSAKEPATVTTAPTGAAVVGVGKTTALVSGGVAEGGTMMYKVTTENTKPASTDGFSADVPTAQSITASGKVYVWYYVKGNDTHSDSEIEATAIEVPVADIVWDPTNVSDLMLYGTDEYEKEGITLSGNADQVDATCYAFGYEETDGIYFNTMESGGFTFTAPAGKKFTKIEMTLPGPAGWDMASENENLGDGWTFVDGYMICTVTWKGSSAASTVGLLTGADQFNGEKVKSIAFYLSNAE